MTPSSRLCTSLLVLALVPGRDGVVQVSAPRTRVVLLGTGSPLYLLAAALILLLIVGMRNAWDMASFLIMREHE